MLYVFRCIVWFMMAVLLMLEKYIKLKEKYPKSVILIKAGNFYDCINDDAIIINNLFNYKIKQLSKYIRLG